MKRDRVPKALCHCWIKSCPMRSLPNEVQQQRNIQLRRNGEHRLRSVFSPLPLHHNRSWRGDHHFKQETRKHRGDA